LFIVDLDEGKILVRGDQETFPVLQFNAFQREFPVDKTERDFVFLPLQAFIDDQQIPIAEIVAHGTAGL